MVFEGEQDSLCLLDTIKNLNQGAVSYLVSATKKAVLDTEFGWVIEYEETSSLAQVSRVDASIPLEKKSVSRKMRGPGKRFRESKPGRWYVFVEFALRKWASVGKMCTFSSLNPLEFVADRSAPRCNFGNFPGGVIYESMPYFLNCILDVDSAKLFGPYEEDADIPAPFDGSSDSSDETVLDEGDGPNDSDREFTRRVFEGNVDGAGEISRGLDNHIGPNRFSVFISPCRGIVTVQWKSDKLGA